MTGPTRGTRKAGGGAAAKQSSRAGKDIDRSNAFAEALRGDGRSLYILKLYVAGTTPRSASAIANIKKICEEHLKGRYRLEVIDVYQQPDLAARDQLVVAPTLIKKLPLPLRMFIGDLSETHKILVGLDLESKKS